MSFLLKSQHDCTIQPTWSVSSTDLSFLSSLEKSTSTITSDPYCGSTTGLSLSEDDISNSNLGPYATHSLSQMREQILQSKIFLAQAQLQSTREDLAQAHRGAQHGALLIRQLQTKLHEKDERISQLSLELELMEAECFFHREIATSSSADLFNECECSRDNVTATATDPTDPWMCSSQPEQEHVHDACEFEQPFLDDLQAPISFIQLLETEDDTTVDPVDTNGKDEQDDGTFPLILDSSISSQTKSCLHTLLCSKTIPHVTENDNAHLHPTVGMNDSRDPRCYYYDSCHHNHHRSVPLLLQSTSSSSTTTTSNHSSPNSLASKLSSLRNWIMNSKTGSSCSSGGGGKKKKRMIPPDDTIPLCIHTTHSLQKKRECDASSTAAAPYHSKSTESVEDETVPILNLSSSPSLCRSLFTRVMGHPRKEKYQSIQVMDVAALSNSSLSILDLLNTSPLFLSNEDEALVVVIQENYVDPCCSLKKRKNSQGESIKNSISTSTTHAISPSPPPVRRSVGIFEFVDKTNVNQDHEHCQTVIDLNGRNPSRDAVERNESIERVGSKPLSNTRRKHRKRDKKRHGYMRASPPLAPLIEELDESRY